MTALKIVLVVLLVLFLLGLIRVGGDVEYSQDGVSVRIRVWAFRFQVYPRKKGEKKRPKKEKNKKEQEKEPEKKGGPMELVKAGLPLVGEAAGALKRRIRIDELLIHYTVGGTDAAKTAMAFGYANAAVGMIWPIFEQNFEVKDYHIHTGVDFQAGRTLIYLKAAFSVRISQLVSFAVIFGVKFFKNYRSGKTLKQKG